MIETATILALHGLLEKLITSVQDRKVAAELRNIQTMIASLSKEHFATRERQIELLETNADLRRQIRDLKSAHSDAAKEMKAKHSKQIAALKKRISDDIDSRPNISQGKGWSI